MTTADASPTLVGDDLLLEFYAAELQAARAPAG